MGGGIAEVAAKSGFDVTACEVTDEFLEKGEARIRKSMERAVQKEKLTAEDRDAALQRPPPSGCGVESLVILFSSVVFAIMETGITRKDQSYGRHAV